MMVAHADVLFEAQKLRVGRGHDAIAQIHLADAIELLTECSCESLSDDRSARDPYRGAETAQQI